MTRVISQRPQRPSQSVIVRLDKKRERLLQHQSQVGEYSVRVSNFYVCA